MLQKGLAKAKTTQSMVLGRHIIAEVRTSNPEILNDDKKLLDALILACKKAGMTIISSSSHKFTPQGVTAVVLLAESHASIHTWPEYGYAAIDIYTCGRNPENVFSELKKILPLKEAKLMTIDRGP